MNLWFYSRHETHNMLAPTHFLMTVNSEVENHKSYNIGTNVGYIIHNIIFCYIVVPLV